jgi:hypothetical protein
VTRHPTTQDLRRSLAAICATPEQQRLVDAALPGHGRKATHFDTRRTGGLEERCVPIMGHAAGAIPGTRPGERL